MPVDPPDGIMGNLPVAYFTSEVDISEVDVAKGARDSTIKEDPIEDEPAFEDEPPIEVEAMEAKSDPHPPPVTVYFAPESLWGPIQ